MVDADTRKIRACSLGGRFPLGHSVGELLRLRVDDLIAPWLLPSLIQCIAGFPHQGSGARALHTPSRDRTGALVWLQIQVTRTTSEQFKGCIAVVVRESQPAPFAEKRGWMPFLWALVDNLPEVLLIKEARSLTIAFANRTAERVLGWSRTELEGKSDFDLWPGEAARDWAVQERETLDRLHTLEMPSLWAKTKQGLRCEFRATKVPVCDPAGAPIFLLCTLRQLRPESPVGTSDLQTTAMATSAVAAQTAMHPFPRATPACRA